MDSVLRNYFAGGRIRKIETNVFEIRQGLGFRPAGGRGRNAGRAFWILAEEAKLKADFLKIEFIYVELNQLVYLDDILFYIFSAQ